jgi:hypothetical protein
MHARSPLWLTLGALLVACVAAAPVDAKTLAFAGYTWEVRSGQGGPGPNPWNPNNAWVDSAGALHLKVAKRAGVWNCAEVYLDQRLGFGTYDFKVTGAIDQLDKNVVLGLFDYPTPDVGPDGTNEIDIEFSHWGNAANPIGNYTIWPPVAGAEPAQRTFSFTLTDDQTTQRFTWAADSMVFRSYSGFAGPNRPVFGAWSYRPTDPAGHIPQNPLPVHMNLWLFEGHAPSNGQPVEIVINDFHFTPQ